MTVNELVNYGTNYLEKDKVNLILSTILGINILEIPLNGDKIIENTVVNQYKEIIKKVQSGKPVQYALGKTCFYGYDFMVNENVLIPRFETEELVFHTIKYLNKYFPNPKVLDMCAGSGCIGLTLKKECPSITITLSDISDKALEVAKDNMQNLNLSGKIILSDLFANIDEKYDVLVANPPYVSDTDIVDELVFKNEPYIALYAKNNGLAIYERILKNCEEYLHDKYMIALEIGASQKEDVINLINTYLKDVLIIARKDASNRDRFIFIFKKINLVE